MHDHTVWGLIGMLRGAEYSQAYRERDGALRPDGRAGAARRRAMSRPCRRAIGDMHRVHNAYDDRVSISIHVYGANIGAVRRRYLPAGGGRKPFVSGYSNTQLPNLWDRSAELLAS